MNPMIPPNISIQKSAGCQALFFWRLPDLKDRIPDETPVYHSDPFSRSDTGHPNQANQNLRVQLDC